MRRFLKMCILLGVLALAPAITYAQTCVPNLPQNFVRAQRACDELGRNTACYGSGQVSAISTGEALTFAAPGDTADLSAISALTTGTVGVTAQTWGIVSMEMQANLLAEEPQRSTSLRLFGEVSLVNAVPAVPELNVTSTGTLNIRAAPDQKADIIDQVGLRETVTANGRTEDGRWLRVLVPREGTIGWLGTEVLAEDTSALAVVDPAQTFYRPFQIMTIATGADDSPCDGVAESGLLIQTPNDFLPVELIINGVPLQVTATVFVQAVDDTLTVNVINGRVDAGTGDEVELAFAGSRLVITDGTIRPAEPYDATDVTSLPLDSLPFVVSAPPPIDPAQLADLIVDATTQVVIAPTATAIDRSRCVYQANTVANLRGGPASFYEVIGKLQYEEVVIPVYQSNDADGSTWYQVRTTAWVRADYITATGDCDEIPTTTALTRPPSQNAMELETCETDNGPLRVGQRLTITFLDGSYPTREEAVASLRFTDGVIKVEDRQLSVHPSEPIKVAEERWYIEFTAYWTARPGSFDITGQRLYLFLLCQVNVPYGR